jgi:CheY-like chemotaxis protein
MTFVLVVEDEESISDPLSYMLRKEGFEVAICPTGPDALEAFDLNGADLVLLDLVLPGAAGTEVCRCLREGSDVPVIMLTAHTAGSGMAHATHRMTRWLISGAVSSAASRSCRAASMPGSAPPPAGPHGTANIWAI